MRCAALNTGSDFHLLDHIAPLAHLMRMPLFLTEEKNYDLACRYYPQIERLYVPDLEQKLGILANRFDALFECKYWAPHLKQLFFDFHKKKMHLIFCPHGQSDKGYATPLLAPYADHDIVLLYGNLLREMLSELKTEVTSAVVGNFRYLFYLQNKVFYDTLVEKEIFSLLPPKKRTLLYAPTWNDADQATSFFQWAPSLFTEIPDDWNLIVKVHPLLEERDPARYYRIAALADRPGVALLSEFPPIYPLLARADAYLGDYSSVGYDFLLFQRPMFFLISPHLPKGRLHSCGTLLDSPRSLFPEMRKQKDFTEEQRALYSHAFAQRHENEAREEILDLLKD